MRLLTRWSALLAVLGGGLLAATIGVLTVDPMSTAWYGMFGGIVLLGFAAPGMHARAGGVTGRLGAVAAWLAGLGALLILAVAGYLIATGKVGADQQALPKGPEGVIAMTASVAWLVGNIGFAFAVIRSRVLAPVGAWLIITGAALPLAMAPLAGDGASALTTQVLTLLFGLVPVGWIVLGSSVVRDHWPAPAA